MGKLNENQKIVTRDVLFFLSEKAVIYLVFILALFAFAVFLRFVLSEVSLNPQAESPTKAIPVFPNPNLNQAFRNAVWEGNLQLIKQLLKKGADINHQGSYGAGEMTPLGAAVKWRHFRVVKYLVSHGADVNEPSFIGYTPLEIAVKYKNLRCMKYLVSHGAEISLKDSYGNFPLSYAARKGELRIVRFLVSHGAEISLKDSYGETALGEALFYHHLRVVKYLLSYGPKWREKTTLLSYSAAVHYPDEYIGQKINWSGSVVSIDTGKGFLEVLRGNSLYPLIVFYKGYCSTSKLAKRGIKDGVKIRIFGVFEGLTSNPSVKVKAIQIERLKTGNPGGRKRRTRVAHDLVKSNSFWMLLHGKQWRMLKVPR